MIAFADLAGQSALIGQLQSDFARGRYVHAYLLTGPGGTGKRSAAQLCAMAALCRGEKKPCGACGPCRRVLSGTHPDVHTVVPEKGKQIIGVGVMREVLDTVSVKSFEDGAKVILIPQAERMNAAAQNCLLKTLEEPPGHDGGSAATLRPARRHSSAVPVSRRAHGRDFAGRRGAGDRLNRKDEAIFDRKMPRRRAILRQRSA